MRTSRITSRYPALVIGAVALTLAACGGAPKPDTASIDQQRAELEQREADLAAKEKALADERAAADAARAELEASEAAAREASAKAEADAAASKAAVDKAAAERAEAQRVAAAKKRDAEFKSTAASNPPAPKPVKPVVVAAGTTLPIAFTGTVSTKTAKVGDPVAARLTEALVVDGRRVAPAGAAVRGVVTEVYSGSREIGGTPKLGIRFEELSLGEGRKVAIAGDIVQQGKRESGKDAAKIAGGAVIGAVIGKQIDDGKGTVIGGLLGGAAGAAVAKNTGADLEIADGAAANLVLSRSFEVR